MKEISKKIKENFFEIAVAVVSLFSIVLLIVSCVLIKCENFRLYEELDKTQLLLEGKVVSIVDIERGGVIYVLYQYDDTEYKILEVDVFPELIYTTIEVGDTVLFVMDRQWTDADLIAVIKQEGK